MTSTPHQLLYTTAGDPSNPPIILVHGLLAYRGVWRNTIPFLQDHFYCVAVELLGFGENAKPADADYSIPAQAARVLALADKLGFARFSLFGHSMGGQISTYLAAKLAPERVERLVSVDGVVTGRLSAYVEQVTGTFIRWCKSAPVYYDITASLVEQFPWYGRFIFKPWFYDMKAQPYADWKLDRQMALQRNGAVSAYRALQCIYQMDLTPWLPGISAKTLVIFGDTDGTVPTDQAYHFKKHFPPARLEIIPRCGHFPMYEAPQTYFDILRSFLEMV